MHVHLENILLITVLATVERTIVSTIVGTIVSRVTWSDERFVDFVNFIKNLILHFVFIH